jgi:hypothetical protein
MCNYYMCKYYLLGGRGPGPVFEEAAEHRDGRVGVLLDVLHDAITQLLVIEPHASGCGCDGDGKRDNERRKKKWIVYERTNNGEITHVRLVQPTHASTLQTTLHKDSA